MNRRVWAVATFALSLSLTVPAGCTGGSTAGSGDDVDTDGGDSWGPYRDLCTIGCTDDAECGTAEDRCLTFRSTEESFCALDCSADPTRCPDGYTCQEVDDGVAQCIPDSGTCDDQCVGVTCEQGSYCDPFTGQCRPRLGLCDTPCERDRACGGEADRCLSFQGSDEGAFCATICPAGGCPTGFSCVPVSGTDYCVPTGGSCHDVAEGLPCTLDSEGEICRGAYDRCAAVGVGPGYCTQACQTDADCPAGSPHCAPLEENGAPICQEAFREGPDHCGAGPGNEQGIGLPCDPAQTPACPDDLTCAHALDPFVAPFCTTTCATDDDCGTGAHCRSTAADGLPRCLPTACSCLATIHTATSTRDLLGEALETAGTSRCGLGFTRDDLVIIPGEIRHDPTRLSFFDPLQRRPLRTADFADEVIADLDQAMAQPAPVQAAIVRAAHRLDVELEVRPSLDPPTGEEALVDALEALVQAGGESLDRTAVTADIAPIPAALRQATARILRAMIPLEAARREAVGDAFDSPAKRTLLYSRIASLVLNSRLDLDLNDAAVRTLLTTGYRGTPLYQAAADLAATVEAAIGDLHPAELSGSFSFRYRTPWGWVVLGDSADTVYEPTDGELAGAIALLIDVGGNDLYRIRVGSNGDADSPAGIAIDLGGDDTYAYREIPDPNDAGLLPSDGYGRYPADPEADPPTGPFSFSTVARQGAGRFGVGLLFDLGNGEDEYRSLRMSQGFGALGVGVLYDEAGNDDFLCEAGCQGAGIFGIGLLLEGDGHDYYSLFHAGQGFGYARGMGVLHDGGGDDIYFADPGPNQPEGEAGGIHLYYSPQSPGESNSSLVQGMGFGRRADGTRDRVFMSGGVGVLRDVAGSDQYTAGIFAQATGYWYGTGLLADGAGDDWYDCRWYCQGAGAHYAIGVLLEGGGNDTFNQGATRMNMATGAGHDFSVGLLIDEWGDDTYLTPNLSLGAGNCNGVGIFVDNGGNDAYTTTGKSLGNGYAGGEAIGPRATRPNFGIFIDAQGADQYSHPHVQERGIGNDATWVPADLNLYEFGAGVDAESGESHLHVR